MTATFDLLFKFEYSLLLILLIAVMAVLYSSVGHGGASGYLAAMLLWGLSPEEMRPAALLMNITVTSWLLWRFRTYHLMSYQLFWPLVIASTPMAFAGGLTQIQPAAYKFFVAIMLVFASVKLVLQDRHSNTYLQPHSTIVFLVGGVLGFAAGVTGIGGGVFLSPILIVLGWCTIRESAAIVAGFILLNSIAGLAGYFVSQYTFPPGMGWLIAAAFAGCLVGGELASHKASSTILRRMLAGVLLIAALKMGYQQIILAF